MREKPTQYRVLQAITDQGEKPKPEQWKIEWAGSEDELRRQHPLKSYSTYDFQETWSDNDGIFTIHRRFQGLIDTSWVDCEDPQLKSR